MSKPPFWGTVTHVLVPIYILQALDMRTGFLINWLWEVCPKKNKKIRRLTREFASAKTNAIEKYGEGLEKMKVNRPGKWKLGQGRNSGTKYAWLYSDLLRAFKGKHLSALGF